MTTHIPRITATVAGLATMALALSACGLGNETKNSRNDAKGVVQAADAKAATPGAGGTTSGGQGSDGIALTWDHDIQSIFAARCAPCHGVKATNDAPTNFQLESYGAAHSINGASSVLDDVKASIVSGSMPPAAFAFQGDEKTKVSGWLDAGAPENSSTVAAAAAAAGSAFSVDTPASSNEVASGTYTVNVTVASSVAGATYALFYTTAAGATAGGLPILNNIALTRTSVTWNISGLKAGTYYVYGVLSEGTTKKAIAAGGSLVIGGGATTTAPGGTDPNVVNFRIASGTNNNAWNSKATAVALKVGQTLRVTNMDTMKHRIHTNGAPFPHGLDIAPGATVDYKIMNTLDTTNMNKPPTYDHNIGGDFWMQATN